MSTELVVGLIGLLGVLAAAWFAYRFDIGNRRAEKRTAFRAKLANMKAMAEMTTDEHFPEWFANSKAAIAGECEAVHNSIGFFHRRKFRAVRDSYAKADLSNIQDFDKTKLPFPESARLMTYQIGKLFVADNLQSLIDCAK